MKRHSHDSCMFTQLLNMKQKRLKTLNEVKLIPKRKGRFTMCSLFIQGEEFTSSQGVSFEGTLTVVDEDGGIVHLPPLDLFEDSNQQHHQSQVDSQDQQE